MAFQVGDIVLSEISDDDRWLASAPMRDWAREGRPLQVLQVNKDGTCRCGPVDQPDDIWYYKESWLRSLHQDVPAVIADQDIHNLLSLA